MAGGGVQKIYMVFLRESSRRDRSGSDLFHLRDGFEIKMNFDRNVSCFIFVNAFMHDDFFYKRLRVAASSSVILAYS